LWVLLVGAYVIDIAWAGFWLAGMDHFPRVGIEVPAPWSHSLTMACILLLGSFAVAGLWSRRRQVRLVVAALAFSHWLVDFITQPMRAAFPGAGFRMRAFFSEQPTIEGFGLYSSALVLNVVEYGALALGVLAYVLAIRQSRVRAVRS
jgi:glucan phosphoethanolaminetransferase (alkaline phosphatase superfamily)